MFEKKEKVLKISPNLERAKSLFKASKKTLRFADSHKLDKENCGEIFKSYYESLLQILHASSYEKGFKILDHITFSEYLKEVLLSRESSLLFDKYRKIRNSLVYYGENIPLEFSKNSIKEIKKIIKFVESKLLK